MYHLATFYKTKFRWVVHFTGIGTLTRIGVVTLYSWCNDLLLGANNSSGVCFTVFLLFFSDGANFYLFLLVQICVIIQGSAHGARGH
jgi:hypothetical protein